MVIGRNRIQCLMTAHRHKMCRDPHRCSDVGGAMELATGANS